MTGSKPTRATSNYVQMRVTLTESGGGQYLVTIFEKPRDRPWTYRHLVSRQQFRMSDPPRTREGVYRILASHLSGLAEPG